MKAFIETHFYSEVAKHMTNVNPTIVAGPAIDRAIQVLTNTVAPNGKATIVEIDPGIARLQASTVQRMSSTLTRDIALVTDDVQNDYVSRFMDIDLTRTLASTKATFQSIISQQRATYPNLSKAFIFTSSLRQMSKARTLATLQTDILPLLGGSCDFTPFTPIEHPDLAKWKQATKFNAYCHISKSASNLDMQLFSYNAGGGPMLTGLIIYT